MLNISKDVLAGVSILDLVMLLEQGKVSKDDALARAITMGARYAGTGKGRRWQTLAQMLGEGGKVDVKAAYAASRDPAKPAAKPAARQTKAAPKIDDAMVDAIAAKVFTLLSAKLGL
jgi:hypothetical protein